MKKMIALTLTLVLALGMFAGCSASNDKTITVAASPTPQAEILKGGEGERGKERWKQDIKELSD